MSIHIQLIMGHGVSGKHVGVGGMFVSWRVVACGMTFLGVWRVWDEDMGVVGAKNFWAEGVFGMVDVGRTRMIGALSALGMACGCG